MRNKNILIIAILLVLIVLVASAALILKPQTNVLPSADNIVQVSATDVPSGDSVATASDAQESSAVLTGSGYVYIQAAGEGRWFELPAEESKLEITRTASDGSEIFNIINLSLDGVFVESASCDNQDCEEQGVVTMENREERVLRNLIVCLPNEVSVELYSAEELMLMLQDAQQQSQE